MRTRRRVLELTGEQQDASRLQLRLGVLGHQIGCPDVLAPGPPPVAVLGVGLGQLETRLAEARVLLHGVAILDDGFLDLLLLPERVPTLHVLALGDFRVARARGDQRGGQQDGQHDAALESWGHLVLLRIHPLDGPLG